MISILALCEFATRPASENPPLETGPTDIVQSNFSRRASYLALGSSLFGLHSIYASTSTTIAWSWTGFPVKGPVIGVHDPMVLSAMSIGAYLSSTTVSSRLVTRSSFISFGAASLYTMFKYRNWVGFIGSLCYAMFLCAILPSVLFQAASLTDNRGSNIASIFGFSWLTYVVISLADVWTVAYAFVPGGKLLRERTDL